MRLGIEFAPLLHKMDLSHHLIVLRDLPCARGFRGFQNLLRESFSLPVLECLWAFRIGPQKMILTERLFLFSASVLNRHHQKFDHYVKLLSPLKLSLMRAPNYLAESLDNSRASVPTRFTKTGSRTVVLLRTSVPSLIGFSRTTPSQAWVRLGRAPSSGLLQMRLALKIGLRSCS